MLSIREVYLLLRAGGDVSAFRWLHLPTYLVSTCIYGDIKYSPVPGSTWPRIPCTQAAWQIAPLYPREFEAI